MKEKFSLGKWLNAIVIGEFAQGIQSYSTNCSYSHTYITLRGISKHREDK